MKNLLKSKPTAALLLAATLAAGRTVAAPSQMPGSPADSSVGSPSTPATNPSRLSLFEVLSEMGMHFFKAFPNVHGGSGLSGHGDPHQSLETKSGKATGTGGQSIGLPH